MKFWERVHFFTPSERDEFNAWRAKVPEPAMA